MHLKRYQAQTVQDALRAVRQDLGPDALVVSTRMIPAPGPRGWFGAKLVQVTAAADRTIVPESRPPERTRPQPEAAAVPVPVPRRTPEAAAAMQPPARLAPRRAPRGRPVPAPRSAVTEQIVRLAAQDEGYAPIEVFVGPPGSGKTTTVAKIAAQERARHGNRLGLVAADAFRVGAVEQLRLYASVIGTPLAVARTPYELQTAIETAAVPVLVDTAGRSAHDETSYDLFRLVAGRPDARTHLVVAADTPLAALRTLLGRFAAAGPSRLVLTRLDEAISLASIVEICRERALRISYLGTGQRVPDDLELATPRALAAWAARIETGHGAGG